MGLLTGQYKGIPWVLDLMWRQYDFGSLVTGPVLIIVCLWSFVLLSHHELTVGLSSGCWA